MKICFICNEYPEGPHGGVGTFTQELARKLVLRGHNVRIIGVYYKTYPSPDYEEDQGVQVYRLRKGNGKFDWVIPWIKQYHIIKSWVRKGEIDILEAPDSSGWFAFWGKMNVPLVLRSNGSNTYFSAIYKRKPNRLTYLLEKLSYNKADFYLAVSRFTAEKTIQVFKLKKPVEIIYNAIQLPVVDTTIARDENVIVFSGTLIEKKGVIELIQAANILSYKGIEFELFLFGKDTIDPVRGPMQAFLNDLIDRKITSKVHFMGNVPRTKLFQFYQKATVAVFPSFMEAFAFAPIESMASGCPTIFSNETSGKELIDHGINGLLVDPHDPEDIAGAIQKILGDKELASRISKNGIEKSKTFDAEKMMEETMSFYKRCIENFKK